MIEAAGGGGGTPWESMTLDKMQELIQNPDTDKQWDLVDGWKKSAELIDEHRWQVENYRDNLATAWSPKKSKAAQEYITRLNVMIDNLKATHEAALANYDAVSRATGAIYQAQVAMEKLYKEYKTNESLLTDFTAKQQQAESTGKPTPSPSPSGEEPPVAPGRQEELRRKAITMLSGVSTDLAQAQLKLVKPPIFRPPDVIDDPGKSIDGQTFVPPPLPLVTPSGSGGSTTGSHRASGAFPTSAVTSSPTVVTPHPPTINPTPIATPPGAQQPGLVLGGTQPLTPSPTPGLTSPAPSTPTGSGPITGPGVLPPSSTLFPGNGGLPLPLSAPTGTGRLPREGMVRPGGLPEGVRPMPPGGIIGGPPGGGLGHPGGGRPGARRVNPVGGVIGEAQGGTGARRGTTGVSSVGEHPMGPYGQGAGRGAGRRDETRDSSWDPDNPWDTAEGVDPVVLPAREQRIDPGPAIGLS